MAKDFFADQGKWAYFVYGKKGLPLKRSFSGRRRRNGMDELCRFQRRSEGYEVCADETQSGEKRLAICACCHFSNKA